MSESQKDALRSLLAEYRPTEFHRYGSAGAGEEADAVFLTCFPRVRELYGSRRVAQQTATARRDESRGAHDLPTV